MAIRTTIPQSHYIRIRTVETNTDQIVRRKLSGLVITQNERAPFNMVVEMGTADDVRQFFGMDSLEYGFAKVYFASIGYNGKVPDSISFTRWCADDADFVPASLSSQECDIDVGAFRRLSDGDLSVTIRTTAGQYAFALNGSEVFGVASIQGFCDLFTSSLKADSFPTWLNESKLTYSEGVFKLVFGNNIDGEILPLADSPIALALGFTEGQQPVVSLVGREEDGKAGAIKRIASFYDDFGSFCFLDTEDDRAAWREIRSRDEFWRKRLNSIKAVDAWLAKEGTRFMSVCGFGRNYSSLLVGSGLSMSTHAVLFDTESYDFEEAEAMGIFATIDYSSENEAEYSWMFRENAYLTPLGATSEEASWYSENSINFYGQTQQVGRTRAFYQPGKNADGTDTSVYCAAVWLKDAMQTAIGNRLLTDEKVDLNEYGLGILGDDLCGVMSEAISNRTIVKPSTLTNVEKITINQIFRNDLAYAEIENDGYCLSLEIANGEVKFVLVYYKNGNIRTIEGTHVIE